MACCVLIMAFIARLFSLRRKVRRALGLPVGDWYDDDSSRSAFSIWGEKLRGLLRKGVTHAVLGALVFAGVVLAIVVAAGGGERASGHRSPGAYTPVCATAEGCQAHN